ncbi:MAG: NAD(P)/FAD-dependent oxidoreductase [Pseudolabrys sp.]
MSKLSRRSFLAGSAALLAAPAVHARDAPDFDMIVVGAGVAGIAAARRALAAKARVALFEASSRVGGRCITDMSLGVPFDLGAHWMRHPSSNPLVKAAPAAGVEVYPAPRGQTVRIGLRDARASELENFLTALVGAQRAIDLAGRKADVAAGSALPPNLGAWRPTVEFVLGPYFCGKPLDQVSARDLAAAGRRDLADFCRQGYGALLAKLAAGTSPQLSTPVTLIDRDRHGVDVRTGKHRLRTRTVIVTVSTNVLAAGKIEYKPGLSRRVRGACNDLALGSYDHIGLMMPGNPLDLQPDDLVFEQASGARTGALLGRVSGTDLHMLEVAGEFGRSLTGQGEAAMLDFAREWLGSLFGSGVKDSIARSQVTRWNQNPWVGGAMSVAGPGHAEARAALMEPMGHRVWFAGEAVHRTKWGTVDGAWESGERAALAALDAMGMLEKPKTERSSHRERTRHHRRRHHRRRRR